MESEQADESWGVVCSFYPENTIDQVWQSRFYFQQPERTNNLFDIHPNMTSQDNMAKTH